MSTTDQILPHYTYKDYLQWEGHWELIEGIPYAMCPQPRPEHQAIAGSLHAALRAAIKKGGCDCKVYQPIDYKVSEDTVLNPDISIMCKPITKSFVDFPPALVVEILSPSTAIKDRHTKHQLYQTQKIPYYLLTDIEQKIIDVFKLAETVYKKQLVDQQQPFTIRFGSCSFNIVFEKIWD